MKDKLVIEEDRVGYRIQWCIAEMEDLGAPLGDSILPRTDPSHDDEDWEHGVASRAASNALPDGRDAMGFYWENKTKAVAALKAANAALKQKPPLLDWEQKALAAGWKAPKGRL